MRWIRTPLFALATTSTLFTGAACATNQAASTQVAMAPKAVEAQEEPADTEPGAAAALKQAFALFAQAEYAMAASFFKTAMASGDLNDAGRALAYWHLYLSEQATHEDKAAMAHLMAFSVVSQDVLEAQETQQDPAMGEFIARFDLYNRLSRARAVLSASWSKHAINFGRNRWQPVVVHDATEKSFFLELVTPCSGGQMESNSGSDVDEVTVTCDGERTKHTYYFTKAADKTHM